VTEADVTSSTFTVEMEEIDAASLDADVTSVVKLIVSLTVVCATLLEAGDGASEDCGTTIGKPLNVVLPLGGASPAQ